MACNVLPCVTFIILHVEICLSTVTIPSYQLQKQFVGSPFQLSASRSLEKSNWVSLYNKLLEKHRNIFHDTGRRAIVSPGSSLYDSQRMSQSEGILPDPHWTEQNPVKEESGAASVTVTNAMPENPYFNVVPYDTPYNIRSVRKSAQPYSPLENPSMNAYMMTPLKVLAQTYEHKSSARNTIRKPDIHIRSKAMSKQEMLLNIKKAIIEKHKIDEESKLIKKAMVDLANNALRKQPRKVRKKNTIANSNVNANVRTYNSFEPYGSYQHLSTYPVLTLNNPEKKNDVPYYPQYWYSNDVVPVSTTTLTVQKSSVPSFPDNTYKTSIYPVASASNAANSMSSLSHDSFITPVQNVNNVTKKTAVPGQEIIKDSKMPVSSESYKKNQTLESKQQQDYAPTSKHSPLKKMLIPHTSTNGWTKHHIFHETQSEKTPSKNAWEYRRVRIFHPNNRIVNSHGMKQNEPVNENNIKRVSVPAPAHSYEETEETNDESEANVDPFFSMANSDEEDNDNIEEGDEDEELPTVGVMKHKKSPPVFDIEAPTAKDVPANVRSQLDHSVVLPQYNIIDEELLPSDEREPIQDEFMTSKKNFQENAEKKSTLNGENIFDLVHKEMSSKESIKGKITEEEMEALKEDKFAKSMMKNRGKAKSEEQPEVVGLGSHGFTSTDRESISGSVNDDSNHNPLMDREGVDADSITGDKSQTNNGDEIQDGNAKQHENIDNGVEKQIIHEEDEGKSSNEEPFENEPAINPGRSSPLEQNNQELKSEGLSMGHSSNAEDTIQQLQTSDAMESEKIVKKLTSSLKQPFEGQKNPHSLKEVDEQFSDSSKDLESDVFGNAKTQENGPQLSENSEMNGEFGDEMIGSKSNALTKGDLFSPLESHEEFSKYSDATPGKPVSGGKVSAEDALHALNGKLSATQLMAKQDYHDKPSEPTSDSNAERKPQTPEKGTDMFTGSDVPPTQADNKTVVKEVVSLLENLALVKNKLRSVENITAAAKNSEEPVKSGDATSESEQRSTNKESINLSKLASTEEAKSKEPTGDETSKKDLSLVDKGDKEERETKEAVHDLNLAINILEEKLLIMKAAKHSGNQKAMYIVNQTLRSPDQVAKSVIIHKLTQNKNSKQIDESNGQSYNGVAKSKTLPREKLKEIRKKKRLKKKKQFQKILKALIDALPKEKDQNVAKLHTPSKKKTLKGINKKKYARRKHKRRSREYKTNFKVKH